MPGLFKEGTYTLIDLPDEGVRACRIESVRYPKGAEERSEPSTISVTVFEDGGEQRLEQTDLSLEEYKRRHKADALAVQTTTLDKIRIAQVTFEDPDRYAYHMTLKPTT